MPEVRLTRALTKEYEGLFESCTILPGRVKDVERIVASLVAGQARYMKVETRLGVPWAFVAVIHSMESGLDFKRHLHNGDPLSARTVNVPAGRPKSGRAPFTWEASAADALTLKRLGKETDWSLAGTLYQLERYNGWGYRLYHPHVRSPYLWSYSSHYESGKYVADGRWSETAVSRQCGAAVLLRRLAENGPFAFAGKPVPAPGALPLVVRYATRRSSDPGVAMQAENLQRWLNSVPGIFLKVDGIPGPRTSDAYRRVTGAYLPGDSRSAAPRANRLDP